jgi:hypothetical protein
VARAQAFRGALGGDLRQGPPLGLVGLHTGLHRVRSVGSGRRICARIRFGKPAPGCLAAQHPETRVSGLRMHEVTEGTL